MQEYSLSEFISFKTLAYRKLLPIFLFFLLTPFALIVSFLSLFYLSAKIPDKETNENKVTSSQTISYGASVFASMPSNYPTVNTNITTGDARPYIIKNYLDSYNSPLAPYYQILVDTADKHGLDYRLLTSIAMKESGLCKIIPPGGHNCWGWGIHKNGTLGFDSYPEAIEAVSKGLKENYKDIGLVTVDQIMTKYIPHSPGGAWAIDVNNYMSQLH